MFTSIWEEPAVRAAVVPLTVEAYHLLGDSGLIPERVELLEGVVVQKMPKSPLHSRINVKLTLALGQAAARAGMHARTAQPVPTETRNQSRTSPWSQAVPTITTSIPREQNWS